MIHRSSELTEKFRDHWDISVWTIHRATLIAWLQKKMQAAHRTGKRAGAGRTAPCDSLKYIRWWKSTQCWPSHRQRMTVFHVNPTCRHMRFKYNLLDYRNKSHMECSRLSFHRYVQKTLQSHGSNDGLFPSDCTLSLIRLTFIRLSTSLTTSTTPTRTKLQSGALCYVTGVKKNISEQVATLEAAYLPSCFR